MRSLAASGQTGSGLASSGVGKITINLILRLTDGGDGIGEEAAFKYVLNS
jgi:hypothetical protein